MLTHLPGELLFPLSALLGDWSGLCSEASLLLPPSTPLSTLSSSSLWGIVASQDTYLPIEEAVEDSHHQPLPEGAEVSAGSPLILGTWAGALL